MPESEIIRFIQTWLIVYACLAYTYAIGKIVPAGKVRALFISPVVALFLLLPLRLTSLTLCFATALLFAWISTFKLALFSFGQGPLATDYPIITFSRFLAVGSLPIILSEKSKVGQKEVDNGDDDPWMQGRVFTVKILLFAFACRFGAHLHPTLVFHMYGAQLYLSLEFMLTAFRAVAGALLGLELDPQFDEPLLSTSVQNFWGRRWNLAVGSILRATVYDPVRALLSAHVGSNNAQRLGVLATFATSALMHELIFYYLSRKRPIWDMTWYFLLQGLTVVVETDVKRRCRQRWRLPRLVSIVVTMGFMTATGLWMFSPQIDHWNGHTRAAEEFAAFAGFVGSLKSGVIFRSFQGPHARAAYLRLRIFAIAHPVGAMGQASM